MFPFSVSYQFLLINYILFKGGCVWSSVTGRQVVLSDTTLLNLTEVERKVLQKVALAKLQALNLGVAVKIPSGKYHFMLAVSINKLQK